MTIWKKCECGEWFVARTGKRGRPRICCEKCNAEVRKIAMSAYQRDHYRGKRNTFSSSDALAELRRRQRAEDRARVAAMETEHIEWRGQYGTRVVR